MAQMNGEAATTLQKRGQSNFHPFTLFQNQLADEEWLEEATNWLIYEATEGFLLCVAKNGKRMRCDCFKVLATQQTAECVAEYLLFFGKASAAERDRIVMDMVRWQEDINPPVPFLSHCHFKFPFVVSPDDDEDQDVKGVLKGHYVCIHALQHLLCFGRKRYSRIRKDINAGLMVPHRPRLGKATKRNLEKEGVVDALHLFFDTLCDYEEPRATRFVREATGVGVREEGIIDLPSYMTKRGLYRQFCYARGTKVTTTQNGKRLYEQRTDDEWKTSGYDEPLPCPSWTSFVNFWKKEYDHVRIQKPLKDICGQCYKFYVENKNNVRKKRSIAVEDDDESVSSSSDGSIAIMAGKNDEVQDDEQDNKDEEQDDNDSNAPLEDDIEVEEEQTHEGIYSTLGGNKEKAILDAAIHVKDAIAQRDLVSTLRRRAVETKEMPPDQRTFLFFFDYAQNLECPYFGHEQPGETYYYSPLSISTFGITDASRDDHLHAFSYHEGEGAKGGNNVVSMIDFYLRRIQNVPAMASMHQDVFWGNHLVFVCDNCNGQNKNRMVIRYLLFLVESRKFKKVTLIFLIVGHTKNPCDRMFNLLKIGYRKRDIFSVEDLVNTLNENPHVDAEQFTKRGFFRNWDAYLHKYYSRPQTVNKWHIFEVDSALQKENPRTLMTFLRSALPGAARMTQQFRSRRRGIENDDNRQAAIEVLLDYPTKIEAPGLRAIKKNELYSKYRKLIPSKYHHLDIYQPPSKSEATMLKEQKAAKVANKRKEKNGGAATTSNKRKRQQEDGQGVSV